MAEDATPAELTANGATDATEAAPAVTAAGAPIVTDAAELPPAARQALASQRQNKIDAEARGKAAARVRTRASADTARAKAAEPKPRKSNGRTAEQKAATAARLAGTKLRDAEIVKRYQQALANGVLSGTCQKVATDMGLTFGVVNTVVYVWKVAEKAAGRTPPSSRLLAGRERVVAERAKAPKKPRKVKPEPDAAADATPVPKVDAKPSGRPAGADPKVKRAPASAAKRRRAKTA